jgi:hypothetical protein
MIAKKVLVFLHKHTVAIMDKAKSKALEAQQKITDESKKMNMMKRRESVSFGEIGKVETEKNASKTFSPSKSFDSSGKDIPPR